MSSLLFLIPAALGLGIVGLAAFLWALHAGQFEDLEGAASRILFDEEGPPPPTKPASKENDHVR